LQKGNILRTHSSWVLGGVAIPAEGLAGAAPERGARVA
jgi:hypothetical protein